VSDLKINREKTEIVITLRGETERLSPADAALFAMVLSAKAQEAGAIIRMNETLAALEAEKAPEETPTEEESDAV
jgi:hypothetical protein